MPKLFSDSKKNSRKCRRNSKETSYAMDSQSSRRNSRAKRPRAPALLWLDISQHISRGSPRRCEETGIARTHPQSSHPAESDYAERQATEHSTGNEGLRRA